MIILDTNVLSELMRDEPAPRVERWVDDQESSELAVTAITVAELRYGIARLPDGARKSRLTESADALVDRGFTDGILPFDHDAAEHYADLAAELDRTGRPIGTPDAQIAAICRAHGATLATRNVRHFAATGVRLVDPWTAGAG